MSSSDFSSLPYRSCVGVMLFNPRFEVWVGQRAPGSGISQDLLAYWQMPQGGIDEGETPREAALRELFEETSITSVEVLSETVGWHFYDLPEALMGKVWKGRFRGQKQKWFAMSFLGEDEEINIVSPPGHDGAEFRTWKWSPFTDLVEGTVPFKRGVYRDVCVEFSSLLPLGRP